MPMHGRIALVTTDPATRVLVPFIVSRAGYTVSALGPLEALGFLCENEADALILDVGPEQAASFVRLAGRCNWRGPTIVLSAGSAADTEIADIEANAFVQKPFGQEEIIAVIARFVPVSV